MSVMIIIEFSGARTGEFLSTYARHAETMKAVVAEARARGAIHHQFVENDRGDVMAVDEWGSREEFEAFFSTQKDIAKIIAEVGVADPPSAVSYRILDTSDRF